MKKTLIAVAALAGFGAAVPAHAQSQYSLYGLIDACYGKSLVADVFLREKADVHSGGDNGNSECNSTTRVGIKGGADVGSGFKINFKFESGGIDSNGFVSGTDTDGDGASDASGSFFARQAWVGISGGFGEIRVGRQDAVPFQVMGDFDFNGMSNGVSAQGYSGVGVWNRGRQSRSIQYIAPTMGGLTAQVGLQIKGNRGAGAKDVLSGGLKYAAGPLAVGVSFQSKESSTTKDFFSVAGSYDLGVVKLMAGYADAGKVADGGAGKGPSIGITAPLGGFTVGAHYSQNSDDNAKIKSTELFVNKEVFKNTYAYLEAGNWKTSLATNPLDATAKTKGSAYALGVIFVF